MAAPRRQSRAGRAYVCRAGQVRPVEVSSTAIDASLEEPEHA